MPTRGVNRKRYKLRDQHVTATVHCVDINATDVAINYKVRGLLYIVLGIERKYKKSFHKELSADSDPSHAIKFTNNQLREPNVCRNTVYKDYLRT